MKNIWGRYSLLLSWLVVMGSGRRDGGIPVIVVDATVVVPAYNKSYSSMPALFGATIPTPPPGGGVGVTARLQFLQSQILMCEEEDDSSSSSSAIINHHNDILGTTTTSDTNNDNNNQEDDQRSSQDHGGIQNTNNEGTTEVETTTANTTAINGSTNSTQIDESNNTNNDIPIALLVQRGKCTFYEKATMAAKYYGMNVRYVIVYDNEISDSLVPMSTESPLQSPAKELSMVFVSYHAGIGTYIRVCVCVCLFLF